MSAFAAKRLFSFALTMTLELVGPSQLARNQGQALVTQPDSPGQSLSSVVKVKKYCQLRPLTL